MRSDVIATCLLSRLVVLHLLVEFTRTALLEK